MLTGDISLTPSVVACFDGFKRMVELPKGR